MIGDILKMSGAAVLEIAGCLFIWRYLREQGSLLDVALATVCLLGFAAILTTVKLDEAGRVFAAYGGIYIAIAAFWSLGKGHLTNTDLIGIGVSVAGTLIILVGHRL